MSEFMNAIPRIGDMAPEFEARTTQGKISFPKDYSGKWILFFSHPGDYSPVCTTEFMILASMLEEFEDINTVCIGLSVDTLSVHIAWLRRIRELSWKNMKHVEVKFPLIEDVTMEIAERYGMVHPSNNILQTVRSVFIIDPAGMIRAILYYPSSTGRNMEELKRLILALQKADDENIVTPANWQPEDDVIIPSPKSYEAAKERMKNRVEGQYCLDWFLCFQQKT